MARILKKIPNFKLPKYKMRDIEDIEELNIEYTPEVIEGLKKKNSKSTGGYQGTEYKTIKEIFLRSTQVYRDRPFILEKFNRKGEMCIRDRGIPGGPLTEYRQTSTLILM